MKPRTLTIIGIIMLAVMVTLVVTKFYPSATKEGYTLIADGPGVVPAGAVDCGSERLDSSRSGYNPTMRSCFYDNWQRCHPAWISRTEVTIEGDPIATIAIINGNNEGGCTALVHYNSEDEYGWKGKQTSACHDVILAMGKCSKTAVCPDLLYITGCDDTSDYEYAI